LNTKSNRDFHDSKLNPTEIEKLTVKQLKTLIGDDTISDDLAENIIDSLYRLSVIAYHTTK
jgi:TolB-like protein